MQNKQTKDITNTDSLFSANRKNWSDAWSWLCLLSTTKYNVKHDKQD